MKLTRKFVLATLVIAAMSAVFTIVYISAVSDYDLRKSCKEKGGAVIRGIGYMGWGWRCDA